VTKVAFQAAASLIVLSGSLGSQSQTGLLWAGGTFPAPIYQKWIESFQARIPGLRIGYEAVGSEAAIQKLKQGEADFAASDFPLSEEARKSLGVRLIPSVLGAAVPAYNIPNLQKDLRFSPQLLADIYLGKVTRWNDPEIKALNRDSHLPAENIAVVHRSDGSGTSYVWTDFLSQTSTEWRSKIGASITPAWPVGQGAKGNDGMADLISRTPFSLGYVEFFYALRYRLSYGEVKNGAGNFVPADIDSLTAAAAAARSEKGDENVSIVCAPGARSYPIAAFTWILIDEKMNPGEKRTRLAAFLDWALSAGQREAGALGYVALPPTLAERERNIAAHIW